ncbi:MAG: hypothetical protein AAFV43_14860 [Planctomycetota bacterium]
MIAASGTATGAFMSGNGDDRAGTISFLAAMLDVAADGVKKGMGKRQIALSLIQGGLATPDLLAGNSIKGRATQCVADVGELGFSLATTAVGGPVAAIVRGSGIIAQILSTGVSCLGFAEAALKGVIAAGKDVAAEVARRFKQVANAVDDIVAVIVRETTNQIRKNLDQGRYNFDGLPAEAQKRLGYFLFIFRQIVALDGFLLRLARERVDDSYAQQFAEAIMITQQANAPADRRSSGTTKSAAAAAERRLANKYRGKAYGAAFNMLLRDLELD